MAVHLVHLHEVLEASSEVYDGGQGQELVGQVTLLPCQVDHEGMGLQCNLVAVLCDPIGNKIVYPTFLQGTTQGLQKRYFIGVSPNPLA